MSAFLLLSILIRILAFIWSIVILQRTRDWRLGLFSVMIALMATRQILTLLKTSDSSGFSFSSLPEEFPGLMVSILVFLGIFFLERLLTGQKKTQADLKRTQEQLVLLLGNLSGMAYRCRNDENRTMEYVSEGCLNLTGYPVSDLKNNAVISYNDLIHPDDQNWLWKKFQVSLEARELCRNEYRIITADKEERWVLDLARGSYSGTGELLSIEGFISDITQRKQGEESLRKSEEKYRVIVGSISEIVYRVYFRGDSIRDVRVDFVSPQTEQVLGFLPEEFQKDPGLWFKILNREDLSAVTRSTQELIDTGKEVLRTYRLRHKTSAETRWIEDKATPVKDSTGKVIGIMGVARDITERKKLEEELQHAGKLEAIGQLAGGIAHEFNNLMTSIIGHLELARLEAGENPRLAPLLITAEQSAKKGVGLTAQLLTFSRKTPAVLQAVDLGVISKEVIQLLHMTIDRRIKIRLEKAEDLWTILADPIQIKQVMMNLCVNSRDSLIERAEKEKSNDINEGWTPRLSIQIKNVSLGPDQVGSNPMAKPGDFVHLSVTDNGMGIDPETRDRIFEPFFTTKPTDVGTGLGLATVHGIVRKHRGWIELDSVVHGTTTFHIFLEKTDEKILAPHPQSGRGSIPGGNELILFVDDEPPIRNLGKIVLEQFGYTVLLARDGDEALSLYSREQNSIGLVVLDMTMPGLPGLTVLRKIQEMNPTAKVIISSGNLQTEKNPLLEVTGRVQQIPKPYHPEELARGIRSLLDQSGPD